MQTGSSGVERLDRSHIVLSMADQDVRLQDYIDDKFQIISDFDTIDSLLQNVQAQQHILKQQAGLALSSGVSLHTDK